nr:uncharacterized protein LOC113822216 [Penaeus vannamei]
MHFNRLVASFVFLAVAGLSRGGPVVVTAPPEVAAQCPYTPGEYPLLLPNPVDCGSFYMCSWYGTALLQHCPPVLTSTPNCRCVTLLNTPTVSRELQLPMSPAPQLLLQPSM